MDGVTGVSTVMDALGMLALHTDRAEITAVYERTQ